MYSVERGSPPEAQHVQPRTGGVTGSGAALITLDYVIDNSNKVRTFVSLQVTDCKFEHRSATRNLPPATRR
jgi:hypothetical protein